MPVPDHFRQVLVFEYVATGLPFLITRHSGHESEQLTRIAAARERHRGAARAPCIIAPTLERAGFTAQADHDAFERGETLFHRGGASKRGRAPGKIALDWLARLDEDDECVLLPEVAPYVLVFLSDDTSSLGIGNRQRAMLARLADRLLGREALRALAAQSAAENAPLLFLRTPEEFRRRGDEEHIGPADVSHWLVRAPAEPSPHVVALGSR